MKLVCLLMLALSSGELFAQNLRDTLFFTNGTVVIGKVKNIKLGVVTFDPDEANDITVRLTKLRSISAVLKIFRVETTRQKVYFGKIIPGKIDGFAYVVTGVDTAEFPLVEISVLYAFKDEIWQRFTGNVSAGFDYTRSSNLGRISFDGTVTYRAQKIEISLPVSLIYSLTDSSFSRDREDISIKTNYYFNTTWFMTIFFKTQRNLELGLQRRFQEGLGGGNKFITTNSIYAWTRLGAVLNQERNTENENSGTLAELFGQLEFNFFRFTKPEVSLYLTETFYYSLSQNGRVRNDASFEVTWKLAKDFNFSISAYTNYDSQPATEDARKLDLGTAFKLSLIF
jgi:hypothetical protein